MTDVGVGECGHSVGVTKGGGGGVGNGLSLQDGDSWETKASELFNLCDRECKGFITKRDLQRLWGELPLGPDELEGVFDSLDEDHNGFLSLEEFTDGFGRHLGLIIQFRADEEPLLTSGEASKDEDANEADDDVTDLSKEELDSLLERLLEQDLESNSAVVEAVWRQVCGARTGVEEAEDGGEGGGGDGSPSQGSGLGRLVVALMQELTRMKHEHTRMEAALAAKAEDYNKQVSKLYEELECQISGERSKVALEHSQKEARALASLETEVAEREAALRSLEDEQLRMRQRLEQVLAAENAARSENSFLSQHVEKLEADLNRRESQVQELQSALDTLKHKTKEEKRRRANQAFKVTEGIARERESLVTQLDLLRSINMQLRDEQDQAGETHSHLRRRCREGGGPGSSGSSSSASTPTSTNGVLGNNSVPSQLMTEGGVRVETTPPTNTRPVPPNHLPLVPSPAHVLSLPPGAWSPSNRSSDCEHDDDYFNNVAMGVGPPMPPLATAVPLEPSLLKELLEQPALCASCGGTNPAPSAPTHALLHRKDSMTQTPSPSSSFSPRLPPTPAPRRVESSSNTVSTEEDEEEEEEEDRGESVTPSEVGLDGICICERRDSQSSVSSQHSATIIIYHPGPRSPSPDAHSPDDQHPPPLGAAHSPLTRTPAHHHKKHPQSTPPRARHNNLGVRFSDELEVQFFETGDGDGSSRVVRRHIVDLTNASDKCTSSVGPDSECSSGCGNSKGSDSSSCGISVEHEVDGDGYSRDTSASGEADACRGMNKCVAGDCEDSVGPDAETSKGCGGSETPKSNSLSKSDGSADLRASSDGRQCDKNDEHDPDGNRANSNINSNRSNGSNGDEEGNSRGDGDNSQPASIHNLQELEPRMTQHLNLHCLRPVFTLEGRRFVSEGQEEALREEMEGETGRGNEEECYIKGSPECRDFHHAKSHFSVFSALVGKDGKRLTDSVDHKKEQNNNDVNTLMASPKTANEKGETEGKKTEKEELKTKGKAAVYPPAIPGPPRMFKVVLIGDSGVGKTSFIHRACTGEFKGDFGCTVGVDYRVLEVVVGGVRAVLQLWDTAGQERFRSITRQYYRKADGVVVMYDVTNEQSFLSVNDWLSSVKETAGADVSVAVLGNKCDLLAARRVSKDTAYKIIRGHNCLMYEVSAASGNGVQESIKHLAALLATQQEHDLVTSSALALHSGDKKKKFCCRD